MNTLRFILVLTVLLIVIPTTSHGEDKPRKDFLSVLKEGQSVIVKEKGDRFEITIMKNLSAAHKVIEIGQDFIVIEDAAGITETRIPVYSIKAIIKVKVPKQ